MIEVTCPVIVHEDPLVSVVRDESRVRSGSRRTGQLTRADIGAWVIKANPSIWDVHAVIEDGAPLNSYRLYDTYRLDLLREGDLVLVWITRDGDRPNGFLGHAFLDGPPELGRGGGEYWTDEDERDAFRPYVPLRGSVWWSGGVDIGECQADPALGDLEVLRAPMISSPSYVTPEQLSRLRTRVTELNA